MNPNMPKLQNERPNPNKITPLTTEEIANVFYMLRLDSEKQREKLRIHSQNTNVTGQEPPKFLLTGTTDFQP
jgi:hypothetical protein